MSVSLNSILRRAVHYYYEQNEYKNIFINENKLNLCYNSPSLTQ